MSVQIAVKHDFPFLHKLACHFPRVPDAGKGLFENGLVVAVEIAACQRATVVAYYNSVRIEHGNYFEYERVAKQLSKVDWNQFIMFKKICTIFKLILYLDYYNTFISI